MSFTCTTWTQPVMIRPSRYVDLAEKHGDGVGSPVNCVFTHSPSFKISSGFQIKKYRRGEVPDATDYGSLTTKFNFETASLKEASVKTLELPIYENTCDYICTEVCYSNCPIWSANPRVQKRTPFLELPLLVWTGSCLLEQTQSQNGAAAFIVTLAMVTRT
jgi:hypothetical protein